MLIILARTSGCAGRADIIEFGSHNITRFRSMRMLENGVPSEPTIFRIENGIDEAAMADRMQAFMGYFNEVLTRFMGSQEIICVDGKVMCGTLLNNGRNQDIVSAHSCNKGLTLATEACQEKSNEIKVVPLLLDKIDISGMVITAEAM